MSWCRQLKAEFWGSEKQNTNMRKWKKTGQPKRQFWYIKASQKYFHNLALQIYADHFPSTPGCQEILTPNFKYFNLLVLGIAQELSDMQCLWCTIWLFLKEQAQQPVKVQTIRASLVGYWNVRLLGSDCWSQWPYLMSDMTVVVHRSDRWKDLWLHPLLGRWSLLIGSATEKQGLQTSRGFVTLWLELMVQTLQRTGQDGAKRPFKGLLNTTHCRWYCHLVQCLSTIL